MTERPISAVIKRWSGTIEYHKAFSMVEERLSITSDGDVLRVWCERVIGKLARTSHGLWWATSPAGLSEGFETRRGACRWLLVRDDLAHRERAITGGI